MVESVTEQNTFSNGTVHQTIIWNFSLISDLFGFSVGTLCNIAVLLLLTIIRVPFSAFNAYLINVLIANIYHDLPGPLLLFLMKIYPSVRYCKVCCTLFLYTQLTSLAVVILSHLLITLNRLWAVTLPHSYRHRHTTRLAVGLCILAWLYSNTFLVAEVILDDMYYRMPVNRMAGRCFMDGRPIKELTSAAMVLHMLFPMATILVTFPVVWFKSQSLLKVKISAQASRPVRTAAANFSMEDRNSSVATGQAVPTTRRREQRNAFMVYFILTFSTVVFWMPITTAFGMTTFMLVPNVTVLTFMQVSYFLFYVENVVDPVILILFHRDWRNGFRQRFFC